MTHSKTLWTLIALFLTSTLAALPAPGERKDAPDSPVNPSAKQTLNVAPLNAVLQIHVRKGHIDYASLKMDQDGRALLKQFLDSAATMPEEEPLASWIDVYNAMVIQLVVERYPIRSVMDVPDFFKKLKRLVAGKKRSLDDIENGVIRPRFEDARVHFALNCGAQSCPPLPNEAFVQSRLDEQLDAVTRAGVNDAAHVSLKGNQLTISELFFWFEEDFKREAGSVVGFIKRYAEPGPLEQLTESTELIRQPYDWKLAATKRSRWK